MVGYIACFDVAGPALLACRQAVSGLSEELWRLGLAQCENDTDCAAMYALIPCNPPSTPSPDCLRGSKYCNGPQPDVLSADESTSTIPTSRDRASLWASRERFVQTVAASP